ncbi:serine hydrolase domain-containing protein [Actinosynnema sp. NPDC023587]|uniref:serine hydrolase domain-containing protein n=1 Tax=Actinosynnema sp. NPDC023587 TaxID=3154695 RepID=UPI00341135AA
MKRSSVVAVVLSVAIGVPVGTAGAATGPVSAESKSSPLSRELQREADAVLPKGVPGVLVELDTARGDVEVRSGVGDKKAKTPIPWNARFRIGSFTKTFVAATVLHLVGEGKLSLDDTVDRRLPGVVSGNGNDGRAITIRHLLQHTSGLHNYTMDLPVLSGEKGWLAHRFTTVTATDAVRLATAAPPDFAPGTGWRYSNTGYVLAGMVIEKVTGRTWQEEVDRRITRPLGLRHTSSPGASPFLPHPHSRAYERFPARMDPQNPQWSAEHDVTLQNTTWAGAAGEMISTTEDANTFLQALFGGRVLKPAQLAEMKRTVPVPPDFGFKDIRYGLGIMHQGNACGGAWSHGGDVVGYMTRNAVTDDGRRSVVVSINSDSPAVDEGSPMQTTDIAADLVERAICGVK